MAYSAYANPAPDLTGIDFDSLTIQRVIAIKPLLPLVVPSTEGDKKFDALMTHEKCVEKRGGEYYGIGTGRPPRRLIGWVDIDRALEIS